MLSLQRRAGEMNALHRTLLLSFCCCGLAVFDAESDEVESMSVTEGEVITLRTGVRNIQEDDLIMWKFGDHFMVKLNTSSQIFSERFRQRLILDPQTGALSISDCRLSDTGVYTAEMMGQRVSKRTFHLSVVARLPVPEIISFCPREPPPSSSSSERKCVLLCSVKVSSAVTLSWFRGDSLFSSIRSSELALSLTLELEDQEKNSYSCVVNNSISNQTQHLDLLQLCRPCEESCHSSAEGVIRLALSALVGVALVVVLVYHCRSGEAEPRRRAPEKGVC